MGITVVGCFEVLILNPKTNTQKDEMGVKLEQYAQELEETEYETYWCINRRNEIVFNDFDDNCRIDDMFEKLQEVCSKIQAIGYEMLGHMTVICSEGHTEMFKMTILNDEDLVNPVLQRLTATFSVV